MNSKVRSILICFLFFVSFASVTFSQDLTNTVLPITDLKLKLKKKSLPSSVSWTALVPKVAPAIEEDFGTGFCIDPECRLIGTNYHVATFARPRKIKGVEVIQRYLATGPDDEGATLNDYLSDRPLKYTLSRDLAIFELRRPLPNYHGPTFSLDDLEIDQQVDIYAYPKESFHPIRSLEKFRGAYRGETTAGFLAFEYEGKSIHGGASGGLVVDSKTHQVVGVLARVGLGKTGKQAALAVPIQSLADFVSKIQPWLAPRIFPSATHAISPTLADLYPNYEWPPATGSLQHRPEEPPEVKVLRAKAQALADSMLTFIALQSFEWGQGNKEPSAAASYEIQVTDGFQRFRDPQSKEELRETPTPDRTSISTGGEWSELPKMVAKELGLKIQQLPDTIGAKPYKVFAYRADVEDGVCKIDYINDLMFLVTHRVVTVACHGEVWTDEDMNILRMSEHLELTGKWKDRGTVVTYGWMRPADEIPRLIPLTISTEAEYRNKVYWCRGLFTNYRVFTSQAKIVASDYVQSLPP